MEPPLTLPTTASPTEETAGVEELFGFPVEDPAQSLPETAQRLLEAARRLLLAGGFDALRLDAIAAESGKNKASIKYHFGNKDGLILAILDSLDYHDCLAFAEHTSGTSGDERLERYIAGQTKLASDADGFLEFFDLLPHVIRDERLRERLAALYEWYYKMNVEWLGLAGRVRPENREQYIAFMSLMVATVDGLALQAALRPKGFDLERSFSVLEFFLKRSLGAFLDSLDGGDAPVSD
jgi:AcrR family transcriptional regulator